MKLKLIVLSACLCAFSTGVTAASSLQLSPVPHIGGSSPVNDTVKPVILRFLLSKNDVVQRSCHGAHLSPPQGHFKHYWILPAECLDKTKYDTIEVEYGYNDSTWAKYYLKDVYFEVHPKYNAATKANNIGLVGLPYLSHLDLEKGFTTLRLPSETDNWVGKTLELYEYKREESNSSYSQGITVLHSVKTSPVNSMWCKIVYPWSPIKDSHICLDGQSIKGLSQQEDMGVSLIARDGDSFKLVGIATMIRPWTSVVSLPIEILSIQPYLEWIKYLSGDD